MTDRGRALREGRVRPTREELEAAAGRGVPDLLTQGLAVVFCGINPGLYTAAVGHHFARPGNRFWPALHQAGFTERLYSPFEEEALLSLGIGITNLVNRATRGAGELRREELRAGVAALRRKVVRYRPRAVAILGLGAYRSGFRRPRAELGRQPDPIGGTLVWVLPNPSGVNAHYQPAALAELFSRLRAALTENHGEEQGEPEG